MHPVSAAHPRVCGENAKLLHVPAAEIGSSPRVRGKRGHRPGGRILPGLIPACAGKTELTGTPDTAERAHPRVCGENEGRLDTRLAIRGSSPRVRGKHKIACCPANVSGLIPACAGKTTVLPTRRTDWRAHPRVCGENSNGQSKCTPVRGSSPRVRGKLCARAIRLLTWGLIPACAGKTSRSRR